MRRFLSALILALSLQANATSFSTDLSDLWWNSSESGWGVNLAQQSGTIFVTMFVYGPSGQATWYVASAAQYVGNSAGHLLFTGQLYQTTGPYFAGSFNPAAVGSRQVGQISFSFDSVNTGAVTYSVDGVSVTKIIGRQTWAINDISGSYIGATIGTYTGCGAASGYAEEPGTLSITQNGTSATFVAQQAAGTCTYSGPYVQSGRMGSISGTLACSNGVGGTFQAFEIEANISGVTGRATANLGGSCSWSGRFGGLRRGQ